MKIGLALSGGFTRGAYQVGVWKAMEELNIIDKLYAISSTSIGALNASILINGDIKVAEELWINTQKSDVLYPKIIKFDKSFPHQLKSYLKFLSRDGICTRNYLIKIMDKYLDYETIKSFDKNFYVCCTDTTQTPNTVHFIRELIKVARKIVRKKIINNKSEKLIENPIPKSNVITQSLKQSISDYLSIKSEYFKLNGNDTEFIKKVLLATSSIPGVFNQIKIGDRYYNDGSMVDAKSIKPLYNEYCDVIIAVMLNKFAKVDTSKYPNAKIITIVLQDNNIGLFEKDFSSWIKQLIDRGYNDAYKRLEKEMLYF